MIFIILATFETAYRIEEEEKRPMAIAFDTLRVGKKYLVKNYGEVNRVEVVERTAEGDFIVKDLLTLEKFSLSEITQYGMSKDFDLFEIR